MARNEEKQYCRLNRMILQQQREENEKKNPTRPSLNTLNSSVEIKRWLPTIKRDIDFYLKQSQVWCYPERKIAEFNTRIDKLRREYHAYVRKLRQLDPSLEVLPGTKRGYTCKRPVDDGNASENQVSSPPNENCGNKSDGDVEEATRISKKFKRIALPILESNIEKQYTEEKLMITNISMPEKLDADLCEASDDSQFYQNPKTKTIDVGNKEPSDRIATFEQANCSVKKTSVSIQPVSYTKRTPDDVSAISKSTNPLGLDYDDSSSEET